MFEGTDVDIERELIKAEDEISESFSISSRLLEYFGSPIIAAKESFHKTGTLRHFIIKVVEKPEHIIPQGLEDGIIQIIINPDLSKEELQQHSTSCNEAILYGIFEDYETIHSTLVEIEKAKYVKEIYANDKVVRDELNSKINYHSSVVSDHINNSLYGSKNTVSWFYKGKPLELNSEKAFNKKLSKIVDDIYFKTPIIKNELFVKNKPSGTISSARSRLLSAAVHKNNNKFFDFEKDKYPPEKTIYLSLLYDTGIHQFNEEKNIWELKRTNK
ncbi:MAG: hypothetical protein U5L09_13385 [Bacteroidales bacterium]|nr:hypothetical protein [Bacteroidales bacterium]